MRDCMDLCFILRRHVELRMDYDTSSQNSWLYDIKHGSVSSTFDAVVLAYTAPSSTQNAAKTIVARIYIFLS